MPRALRRGTAVPTSSSAPSADAVTCVAFTGRVNHHSALMQTQAEHGLRLEGGRKKAHSAGTSYNSKTGLARTSQLERSLLQELQVAVLLWIHQSLEEESKGVRGEAS